MKWLHSHDWDYWSGGRLELHGKVFMISLYYCQCGKWKSRAADMQPYLDLKMIKIGENIEV